MRYSEIMTEAEVNDDRRRLLALFDELASIPSTSKTKPREQVAAALMAVSDDELPEWEQELTAAIATRRDESERQQAAQTQRKPQRQARKVSPMPHDADTDEVDDEDASWDDRWGAKTILSRGLILYHGTADRFDTFNRPTWFSTSRPTAHWFAERAAQNGGRARVMRCRLRADITLPRIENRSDMARFEEMFYIDTMSAEDMRNSVSNANLPGWYIPTNYAAGQGTGGAGDDILITDPESVVSG
jgi:hypothetical protein